MRNLLGILFLVLSTHSALAADFVCSSSSSLSMSMTGLELEPAASIYGISLSDNTVPKSVALLGFAESADSVYIEFINLETVSAFNFEIGKESIKFGAFSISVFELGSPGSESQYHIFSCQKL